jgi:hypothetical protein
MRELILVEIVAVPAERSRGRHNPRVVKRKMSSFPTKARAAPGVPLRGPHPRRRPARSASGSSADADRSARGEVEEVSTAKGLGRPDRRPAVLAGTGPLLAGQRPVARRLLRAPQPQPAHLPSLGGALATELQEARPALAP